MSERSPPPTSPSKRDDEMDPAQYEHPPGLMPSSDHDFDCIDTGEFVTVYEIGALSETRLTSDVHHAVFQ